MSSRNNIQRWPLIICVLLMEQSLSATPVRCSPGYQDSSCTTPVSLAPIPQPQCSSGAGWTTVATATWQGAQWSAPSCNYQAPPVCLPGYSQIVAPSWNGVNWVGLGCQPNTPPAPTYSLTLYAASTDDSDGYAVATVWANGVLAGGVPVKFTSYLGILDYNTGAANPQFTFNTVSDGTAKVSWIGPYCVPGSTGEYFPITATVGGQSASVTIFIPSNPCHS
ncbi:hypothetical protein B0G77_8278 [Paraburkholderia sp. BL10I2N1]|nr:hypothetical protein B0G77_8278 [Paraburkholderia sp. BL10I2N1]